MMWKPTIFQPTCKLDTEPRKFLGLLEVTGGLGWFIVKVTQVASLHMKLNLDISETRNSALSHVTGSLWTMKV